MCEKTGGSAGELTFLEDLGAVDADQPRVGVLVLLAVAHGGRNGGDGGGERSEGGRGALRAEAVGGGSRARLPPWGHLHIPDSTTITAKSPKSPLWANR